MAAVNIFTGEKLFSLPLPSTPVASPGGDRPELWGDINGDDVIEHIQVQKIKLLHLLARFDGIERFNSGGREKW